MKNKLETLGILTAIVGVIGLLIFSPVITFGLAWVGGVVDLSYPQSKTRRGRVQENGEICPTITASNIGICLIEKLE